MSKYEFRKNQNKTESAPVVSTETGNCTDLEFNLKGGQLHPADSNFSYRITFHIYVQWILGTQLDHEFRLL